MANNTAAKGIMGNRNEGVAVSEVAGVIGGLLGGVVALAEGSTKTGAITGALVGAVAGYGMGAFLAPISNNLGTGTKILTGALSGSFGLSVSQVGALIGNSFSKVSDL